MLVVMGPVPYNDVLEMNTMERRMLVEVYQERTDAQSPNKQKQMKMTPGQVNGPQGPAPTRSESR